ncbi:DNA topoisomerase-3 [Bacillus pakistanensis]|uniref:DNA topoisomerase n=1 Tax=Rossellomorea pakistanensis TaxID=992288 RepID=A0ABS2N7R8_9BACI|nr:DNA topoisomerase III [Bacillus pakistanensis]MBM7583869.1 DNA topoisomerase-3 [Bacillus pakistanensis]
MKVIIAEKPDQGAALAKPFSSVKKQGYIEIQANEFFPNGALITWAVGHLLQLQAPEKYESQWKKWSLDYLPIIPERFQYEITAGKRKQYLIVANLLKKAEVDEIIHAGDAGREGELIIRNIIQMSGVRKPMKRLWISSLTPNAIKDGFRNLLEDNQTRSLYYEAYSRACADWIVGMNASRVYTLLLNKHGMSDIFSAGRVQTPTLALIVRRDKEIDAFKSEPFWEVIATFNHEGKTFQGKWEGEKGSRIKEEDLAKKIAKFCEGKPSKIESIDSERKEYQPPMLFNLSSIQSTANNMYKFPPKKTLDVLQKLYQKGIVSYPRSDSQHVTSEEARAFPDILSKIEKLPKYKELFPLPKDTIIHNKRFVNEKKVTDHYAIIPTEQIKDPDKLSDDERKIYDLILKRLISAHYDSSIINTTTITTLVDERAKFLSKGSQVVQEGFRKVIPIKQKDHEIKLPNIEKGSSGKVAKIDLKEGKTQPPKRYTEGQLITLMKTAGKYIENEQLEQVLMRTEGLGTEATRAGIITMLKDRKYIEVKKNIVYPTDKGKVLIDAIGEKVLASPEMTAKWEQRLKEIGEEKASAPEFMAQVKKLCTKIIEDAVNTSHSWNFSKYDTSTIQKKSKSKGRTGSIGNCPICNGKVVDKGKFYGCHQYNKTKCPFTISKKILSKSITQKNIKLLLKEGKTEMIDGFSKGEKKFSAALAWDKAERKVNFVFES